MADADGYRADPTWDDEDDETEVKDAWDDEEDDVEEDKEEVVATETEQLQTVTDATQELALEEDSDENRDDIEDIKYKPTDEDEEDEEEEDAGVDVDRLTDEEDCGDDDFSDAEEISDEDKEFLRLPSAICQHLYIKAFRIDLNLMHDFTESDLFAIDGDSILADIFAQQGLDFTHGLQLLHLVYLVELFLEDFHKREGKFDIIFFTDAESLWHSNPLKLLARRALIQHLTSNTDCHIVTDIPNPFTIKWKEYIEQQHPAFILLSDGESLKRRDGRRMLMRALLTSAVNLGVDCSFCTPMRRSLRSVNTFYVEARKAERFLMRTVKLINEKDAKDLDGLAIVGKAYERTVDNLKVKNGQSLTDEELAKICDNLLASIETYSNNGVPQLCSIRDIITVIACARVIGGAFHEGELDDSQKTFTEGLSKACIQQAVLLQYLPLEARAQTIPDKAEILPDFKGPMHGFLKRIHFAMASLVASHELLGDKLASIEGVRETYSLADLIDGRLLHVVLYQLQKYTDDGIQASYPEEVQSKVRFLCELTQSLASKQSGITNGVVPEEDTQGGLLNAAPVKLFKSTSQELGSDSSLSNSLSGLVPVSAKLVKDYAGDLQKELASTNLVNIRSASAKTKVFEEKYHWHSGKPLQDDFDNTKVDFMQEKLPEDPWLRKKALKQRQKFSRYMQRYGESLEGKAHTLKPQTITVDRGTAGGAKKEDGDHQKRKNKGLTKKEQILQDKIQKDKEKADSVAGDKWRAVLTRVKSDVDGRMYKAAVKKMDDFIHHCTSDKWRIEVLLAKMDCYWIAWKEAHKTSVLKPMTFSELTMDNPIYFPIMLFVLGNETVEDDREVMNEKQIQLVADYFHGLGFHSLADSIQPEEASSKMTKTCFSLRYPMRDEATIKMTRTRFQLQYVGQWMKRDVRKDKDIRCQNFIPDTWQRELLDIVDNNESALIVAPTSSGKTYASYYAMEKVLRQSDDGVVVYVSPTKALMNQVAATVYTRFNKKLPPGKVVSGVFSRDFKRNALNCQVLVTVPQCLEILLLSPRRQEWVSKIQYIIFDEVHCLGGEIGAEVWEHLLVAIKCPFLALSATICNPEDIRGWLQASQDFKQLQAGEVAKQTTKKQKKRGNVKAESNTYKVKLVLVKERHSDLEKYVYMPTARREEVIKLNDKVLSVTDDFLPLHPVAMLDLDKVKLQGLPFDLSLSPREALVLYDTMKVVHPKCPRLEKLDPEVYFKAITVMEKKDVRNYENHLKKLLLDWLAEAENTEKVVAVVEKLHHDLEKQETVSKQAWTHTHGLHNDDAAIENYGILCRQLNQQKKLPAIVFSQNRMLCERLADAVVASLKETEDQLREAFVKTEQFKDAMKILSRLDKTVKRIKNKESEDTDNQRRKRWENQSEDYRDAKRFDACYKEANDKERKILNTAKYYLLAEPLPSCTLQGEGHMSKQEVEEELARLRPDDKLRELIARGVAYHHAGLNNKQRVAVETLFRMKYIKVLTATATLALGIHVPCKTVVFACEDLWLKPLAYRQMAGRSGRRGFDLVGNVIFLSVPPQKIRHLITSGLPRIRGHFPFSVSFVLRLMVLTHDSGDKRAAHEKALSLLKHPFVCYDAADMEEVVQHFFLFSVDYLIRAGLLDVNGAPIGFAGLGTHLHYHEPANLALVTMIQEGAFHKLCVPNTDGTFSKNIMETMVLVLAHMFHRLLMHSSTLQRVRRGTTHSKVILDKSIPMPPYFADIMKKHNKEASEVFQRYVHTVCEYSGKRNDTVEQTKLPLSKVALPHNPPSLDSVAEDGNLVTKLQASANHSSTLSPFIMTSGHTDKDLLKFEADISQAIRQGVHIETTKIPTLAPADELKDSRGKDIYINAFAYDFFKHGSVKVIQRENRLESGAVFDSLKDFLLIIAAISVALSELGPKEDNVVLAFKQLREEFQDKFNLQYGGAPF